MATSAKSRRDDELTELLMKLYEIQEDIGAKPKTTEDEKKAKAENVAVMGTGGSKKTEKKGSKFLELKSSIVDRLKQVHQLLKSTKEKEAAGYGGDNAKEIIKMQAEIREQLRQAGEEWAEMDEIYKNEARKKKSKFTPEELEVQCELVRRLHVELEKVKEAQMRGYAKNRDSGAAGVGGSKALYVDSVLSKSGSKPSWASSKGSGVAITENQRSQIMALEERDADFDKQLDEIGEGIQDLAEIAALQGEEVKKQSDLLDQVNSKMDRVNERLLGVNTKMKETLEEVGRPSGKLCVDIMCIVLALGFAAIIYNLVTKGTI